MANRNLNWGYEDEKRTNGLALLFLGAAIGAAVALLYAPQSGGDTRKRITDRAHDWKDDAVQFGHDAGERAHDWKSLLLRKADAIRNA